MNRLSRLWERAPLWRAALLGAIVCTVLVMLFPPQSSMPPGSQASLPTGIPPIPTGVGGSYQPPPPAGGPVPVASMAPITPVAPAPVTITPSRPVDPAALPPAPIKPTASPEFGVYRGDDSTKIRPSGQILPSGPKLAPSDAAETNKD